MRWPGARGWSRACLEPSASTGASWEGEIVRSVCLIVVVSLCLCDLVPNCEGGRRA